VSPKGGGGQPKCHVTFFIFLNVCMRVFLCTAIKHSFIGQCRQMTQGGGRGLKMSKKRHILFKWPQTRMKYVKMKLSKNCLQIVLIEVNG
jgi:hypothetical protein